MQPLELAHGRVEHQRVHLLAQGKKDGVGREKEGGGDARGKKRQKTQGQNREGEGEDDGTKERDKNNKRPVS